MQRWVIRMYVDCLLAGCVKAMWRRDQRSWQQVLDVDKVHQQRGALVTNGHFSVLSASNAATKLNRHLCHSFSRKNQKVFDLHAKIECMAGLAFRHHFFPNVCTQRSKTCCKEPKSCSPEQWKALHINELIQSFGSVHGKQIYTSFILQRGDFLQFSKHRFKLWKRLKKAWICFQSEVWRCTSLRCFMIFGIPVRWEVGGFEMWESRYSVVIARWKKAVKMNCDQNVFGQ